MARKISNNMGKIMLLQTCHIRRSEEFSRPNRESESQNFWRTSNGLASGIGK